jgi:hypothetical protein
VRDISQVAISPRKVAILPDITATGDGSGLYFRNLQVEKRTVLSQIHPSKERKL